MAWQYKDIDTTDIQLRLGAKGRYAELYDKISNLKVGKGFEIEADTIRAAGNIRAAVSKFLRTKGLLDRYIVSNRLNKFYCGRIK